MLICFANSCQSKCFRVRQGHLPTEVTKIFCYHTLVPPKLKMNKAHMFCCLEFVKVRITLLLNQPMLQNVGIA